MTGPRNWDKELADIDKLMGAPAAPPPASPQAPNLPAPRGQAPAAPARPAASAPSGVATRPRDTLVVWLKVGLGGLGAGALAAWPYDKHCGMMLYGYLLGVTAVGGAGVWAMLGAWTHRRGLAHTVGLLVLLAGLVLAAIEILPRTGYTVPALTWTCSP